MLATKNFFMGDRGYFQAVFKVCADGLWPKKREAIT